MRECTGSRGRGIRHGVMLCDVCTRPLRQQVDFVGEAERLLKIVGDQHNTDPSALDQRTTPAMHQRPRSHRERRTARPSGSAWAASPTPARARRASRWPPAQLTGNRSPSRPDPADRAMLPPRRALLLRSMPLKVSPSATLSRRLPRQQGIVLEQMPRCVRAGFISTVPESGRCNPITARKRLDLPEPEGPTRLTKRPSSTARFTPSRTGSPPYEMVRSRTRSFQPPAIVVSCSPDMLAPDLRRPPAIKLCSTRLAASRSMVTVSG